MTEPSGSTSGSAAAIPVLTRGPEAVLPRKQYAETLTLSVGMSGCGALAAVGVQEPIADAATITPHSFRSTDRQEQCAYPIEREPYRSGLMVCTS
jgi:hypothetical protein